MKDPEEVGNYSVLGDWLTEQGDPRGEFVGVQIALENDSLTAPQRKKLQEQEQDLLQQHQRAWLGELAPYLIDQKDEDFYLFARRAAEPWRKPEPNCFQYEFARGILDTVRMREFSIELGHVLKNSVHCSMLRCLIIERSDPMPRTIDGTTYEEMDSLVGADFANLRVFQHGRLDESAICGFHPAMSFCPGYTVVDLIETDAPDRRTTTRGLRS